MSSSSWLYCLLYLLGQQIGLTIMLDV